jgi:hypothetical protein
VYLEQTIKQYGRPKWLLYRTRKERVEGSAVLTNRGSLETHNRCAEGAYRQGDTKFREGDGSGSERKGLWLDWP